MYCERWESSTIHTQALHIHQGLDNFKQRITRQNDAKNRNLAKTKSIDSVTSLDLKQLSVLMKYRYIAIRWMIVINMSYRVKKLVCDSQINDSRCQLQSLCIPTLSQPLTRRTDTSLSCYHVWPCLVSLPSTLNCKCSMNHTRKRVTFILSWTFWFDYKRVWRDTCSMSCHWSARPRSKMTISAQSIVHSVARVCEGSTESETSCTCGWWVLKWCWGEALQGWTIHLYLLQKVQSTTLIQQGDLSIASVFPQWISLWLHIHHEIHRIDGKGGKICGSHSNYQGQGNADRIPWYSIQRLIETDQ